MTTNEMDVLNILTTSLGKLQHTLSDVYVFGVPVLYILVFFFVMTVLTTIIFRIFGYEVDDD